MPTQRPSVEEVDVGSVKLRAWDLGGHRQVLRLDHQTMVCGFVNTHSTEQVRAWWRDYFVEADAIVFVVDSSDVERMAEAREVCVLQPQLRKRTGRLTS